jgi:SPX domain protein involved in polyphosphate accumulation
LASSPREVAFFKLLHSEFQKICVFFHASHQELTIREERLQESIEILQKGIPQTANRSSLGRSILSFRQDLCELETFCILNVCAFSKILKKHDKITGCATREAYIKSFVSKANFMNYHWLKRMIDRCELFYSQNRQPAFDDERLFLSVVNQINRQGLHGPQQGVRSNVQGNVQDAQRKRPLENQNEAGELNVNAPEEAKKVRKVTF